MTLQALVNAALVPLLFALAVVWLALSIYLVDAARRGRERASIVARTLAEVRRVESSGMLPEEQVRQLEALVSGTDRRMLLRVAMALPEKSPATEIFARSATTCHDLAWFVEQASAWRGPRANWRRISCVCGGFLNQRAPGATEPAEGLAVLEPGGIAGFFDPALAGS